MHLPPPAIESDTYQRLIHSSDTPQLISRASRVSSQNSGAEPGIKSVSTLCLHDIHGLLNGPSPLTRNTSSKSAAEKRHAWPCPHLPCCTHLFVWGPSGPRTSFYLNLLSSPAVSLIHRIPNTPKAGRRVSLHSLSAPRLEQNLCPMY